MCDCVNDKYCQRAKIFSRILCKKQYGHMHTIVINSIICNHM